MVSDSVQKLDGTIEEDAANVDGSVPKRPHLEEKANGSVHLEIRIIQKGSVGIHASLCGVVGLKTTFGRTDMIGLVHEWQVTVGSRNCYRTHHSYSMQQSRDISS
ncbi:uncharacterized protein LOC125844798 isoform X2 [Solanum stenotomum]|uniref:uncharacterized protein LOC125844798 isoform X2 n=1 Tax=Solanum stenotomum TaxID=172797 RepID=UPI0020D1D86E|nr:uncharacterized protein LOC125844798 isoform X2 [Solanum stenotomum]